MFNIFSAFSTRCIISTCLECLRTGPLSALTIYLSPSSVAGHRGGSAFYNIVNYTGVSIIVLWLPLGCTPHPWDRVTVDWRGFGTWGSGCVLSNWFPRDSLCPSAPVCKGRGSGHVSRAPWPWCPAGDTRSEPLLSLPGNTSYWERAKGSTRSQQAPLGKGLGLLTGKWMLPGIWEPAAPWRLTFACVLSDCSVG